MKKLLTLAIATVFASSLAFAQKGHGAKKGFKDGRPGLFAGVRDDAKMKEMREEMEKNRKEMKELSEKYNKETDPQKKAAAESEIKAKVAANYDKSIARMEERVKEQKERLGKAEQMLADGQKPEIRQKHIDEITQRVISGKEGWGKSGKKAKKGKDKKAAKK
jgi:chromatin segregation and condensation protein Rec8/ScpA/Scc1 (kleisin family)